MDLASRLVHSKDEVVKMVLGQEYLQSIITGGGFNKGSIVLTDRRVYQAGRAYTRTQRGMKKLKSNTTLDISDVTGVTVEMVSNLLSLIAIFWGLFTIGSTIIPLLTIETDLIFEALEEMPLLLLVIVIPILLGAGALYLGAVVMKPKKYLLIQYAGGIIAFEHTWYSESDINAFQKAVFEEKDRIKSQSQGQVQVPVQEVKTEGSYIEELKQLAELRDNGLITDDQFEAKRNQILG